MPLGTDLPQNAGSGWHGTSWKSWGSCNGHQICHRAALPRAAKWQSFSATIGDSSMQWNSEALNNCKLILSLSKELKTFKLKSKGKKKIRGKKRVGCWRYDEKIAGCFKLFKSIKVAYPCGKLTFAICLTIQLMLGNQYQFLGFSSQLSPSSHSNSKGCSKG